MTYIIKDRELAAKYNFKNEAIEITEVNSYNRGLGAPKYNNNHNPIKILGKAPGMPLGEYIEALKEIQKEHPNSYIPKDEIYCTISLPDIEYITTRKEEEYQTIERLRKVEIDKLKALESFKESYDVIKDIDDN